MKIPRYTFRCNSGVLFVASRGMSLIELFSCVVIVAILGAVLAYSIRTAIEHAQSSRSLSEKRQIAIALSLYAIDHDQQYPPVAPESSRPWMRTPLIPYLPFSARFNSGGVASNEHPIFSAPGAIVRGGGDVRVRRAYSGGGALYITSGNTPTSNAGSASAPERGRLLSTITNPENGVLFFDAVVGANGLCRDGTSWSRFSEDLGVVDANLNVYRYVDFRYDGKAQLMFADYHIESLTPEELSGRFSESGIYEGLK